MYDACEFGFYESLKYKRLLCVRASTVHLIGFIQVQFQTYGVALSKQLCMMHLSLASTNPLIANVCTCTCTCMCACFSMLYGTFDWHYLSSISNLWCSSKQTIIMKISHFYIYMYMYMSYKITYMYMLVYMQNLPFLV